MANTVETTTLVDGSRDLIVRIHLDSDGASGELSNQVIVDASTFTPAFTEVKLMKIKSNLIGFTAELIWDADTDAHAWVCPDYEQNMDFTDMGGIPNANLTNPTGDILLTTSGFTATTDTGHILLYLKKKNNV